MTINDAFRNDFLCFITFSHETGAGHKMCPAHRIQGFAIPQTGLTAADHN